MYKVVFVLSLFQCVSLLGADVGVSGRFVKPNAEQMLIVNALKALRIKEEKNASEISEDHDITAENIKKKYDVLYGMYSADPHKSKKLDEIKAAKDKLGENSGYTTLVISGEKFKTINSAWTVWKTYYDAIKQEFIHTQKIPADAPAVILWKIATSHDPSEQTKDPGFCSVTFSGIKEHLLGKPWKKSKCFKESKNGFLSTYPSALLLSELRQEKRTVKWATDKIVPKEGKWEHGALKRMSHLLLLADGHNKEKVQTKKNKIKDCFDAYERINGSVPPAAECADFFMNIKEKTHVYAVISSPRDSASSIDSRRTSTESIDSVRSSSLPTCDANVWKGTDLRAKKKCCKDLVDMRTPCEKLGNAHLSLGEQRERKTPVAAGLLYKTCYDNIIACSRDKKEKEARTIAQAKLTMENYQRMCNQAIEQNRENVKCKSELESFKAAAEGIPLDEQDADTYKDRAVLYNGCFMLPVLDQDNHSREKLECTAP